ncbi:mirror-image polydactyly gene 1 protein isoform X2 [Osmerus eperlanus]
MYKANPKVNEELKQRLPSPVRPSYSRTTSPLGLSEAGVAPSTLSVPDLSSGDRPQAPKHLQASRSPSPQPGSPRSPHKSPAPWAPRSPGLPSFPALPRSPGSPRSLAPQGPGRVMMEGVRGPSRSPSTGEGPRADSTSEGLEGRGRSPESPAHRRHLLPPASPESSQAHTLGVLQDQEAPRDPPSPACRKGSPALDKDKNIAFLLKELDSLRDLNNKLQDKLTLKEKELESRLVDAELQEAEVEARVCEKAGALVEEIYQAQRERDQAVMARLRLANEERDEALLRAKRLQQAAAEMERIDPEESDVDLEELLNRVNSADSAVSLERSGAVLVDLLQKARERHRKITAEEMNTVLQERDTAQAKWKRVEQELRMVREQSQTSANSSSSSSRHLAEDHHQGRARKEQLDAVQRERDRALEHSQRLEEELQALRTYQSLHQSQCDHRQPGSSLSPPSLLTPRADKTLVPRDASSPLGSLAQPAPLLAQLQQMATEQHSTQVLLQRSQQAEREANERVQKLERLVEVLRKKVGTGSVRTVI